MRAASSFVRRLACGLALASLCQCAKDPTAIVVSVTVEGIALVSMVRMVVYSPASAPSPRPGGSTRNLVEPITFLVTPGDATGPVRIEVFAQAPAGMPRMGEPVTLTDLAYDRVVVSFQTDRTLVVPMVLHGACSPMMHPCPNDQRCTGMGPCVTASVASPQTYSF